MLAPKKDKTLSKIIITFLIVGVLAIGGYYLWGLRSSSSAPSVASTTSSEPAPQSNDIQNARELIAQGKTDDAKKALKSIMDTQDSTDRLSALVLLAKTESQTGNAPEAKRLLETAYKENVSSPEYPKIAAAYARVLEDSGSVDEALKIYQEVHDKSPGDVRAPATTGLGRIAEKNKDLLKAQGFYREAFEEAPWDSDEWNEALDALGRINVALLFSPMETSESKVHVVGKGESITSIGNALNTTQGLLMRANNIDESTVLSMGRRLKYTPKDFRIVIERSRCRLFLLDKDGVFKRYSCGLGAPGHETTLGLYKIGNKEKNPIWHKPGAAPVPAGDPANQLGTRWMPLVPDQEGLPRDLGIHGTIAPETVGKYTSNGCARLIPAEIEELYDLVVRSTPVEIADVAAPDKIKNAAAPAETPAAH
jgi:tetratricopeptide (TPR) repeat protein